MVGQLRWKARLPQHDLEARGTMITTIRNIPTGFMVGLRTKDRSFLGILAICLLTVPLMVVLKAILLHTPITWAFVAGSEPAFWYSLAFFAYILVIKSLQVFHLREGNEATAKKLILQLDCVVMLTLIVLVGSQMLG